MSSRGSGGDGNGGERQHGDMIFRLRRTRRAHPTAGLCLLASLALIAPVADAAEPAEVTITTPVRQTLQRIQEDWQAWKRGYYQNNREVAEAARASLEEAASDVGMRYLPELAAATAAYAHRSAAGGNFSRAQWALEDARALDPARPEIDLVRTSVAWQKGDYLQSASALARGLLRILRLEITRITLVHNVLLWLVLVLLVSGSCFVVVQMAVKGADLIADLCGLLSPLPTPLAFPLVAALLLWPLALPGGLPWLLLYWTVLLFGYASTSERVVLVLFVLGMAVVPVGLRMQQRAVELARSSPTRLLTALERGSLYSGLFADLEVLRGLLGEHAAVVELEADLHRRLGQWELARLRWGTVAELDPTNGAALNNLGVYHLRKQDFGSAIGYLERAGEVEPDMAEAFFNLSQAYSSSYAFGESHEALAQAKSIDRARVDAWLEQGGDDQAVSVAGSTARHGEIRAALLTQWGGEPWQDAWAQLRRELGVPVAVAVLLIALALHAVRRRFGYSDRLLGGRAARHTGTRVLRALVPGWMAAERGHGGRGVGMILLVVAIVALPAAGQLRYRLPVHVDLGSGLLLLVISLASLALFVVIRLGQEFAAGGQR